MRILGMRGIWNPYSGTHSFVDKLLQTMHTKYGHEVVTVRYPWTWALLTGYSDRGKRIRAQMLLDLYKPGDVVVAFSMGVLLTIRAMQMGGKFGKVFFFAGAAESDAEFPADAYERIWNVYSKTDGALALGGILPLHQFGELGLTGYRGPNARVTNYPAHGLKHSDYAQPRQVTRWARFTQQRIVEDENRVAA